MVVPEAFFGGFGAQYSGLTPRGKAHHRTGDYTYTSYVMRFSVLGPSFG